MSSQLNKLALFKEGENPEYLRHLFEVSPSFCTYQHSAPVIRQSAYNNRYLLYRHYERMASIMSVAAKRDVFLDVGCGFGDLSLEIASNGYRIISLDLSRQRLEVAKLRLKKFSLDGNFVLADAHNLPFRDCTFDIVISDQVIEHVREARRYIQEKKRISKRLSIEICMNNSRLSLLSFLYYKIITRGPVEVVPEIEGYSDTKYINLDLFPLNSKITIFVAQLLGKSKFIGRLFGGNVVKIYKSKSSRTKC